MLVNFPHDIQVWWFTVVWNDVSCSPEESPCASRVFYKPSFLVLSDRYWSLVACLSQCLIDFQVVVWFVYNHCSVFLVHRKVFFLVLFSVVLFSAGNSGRVRLLSSLFFFFSSIVQTCHLNSFKCGWIVSNELTRFNTGTYLDVTEKFSLFCRSVCSAQVGNFD